MKQIPPDQVQYKMNNLSKLQLSTTITFQGSTLKIHLSSLSATLRATFFSWCFWRGPANASSTWLSRYWLLFLMMMIYLTWWRQRWPREVRGIWKKSINPIPVNLLLLQCTWDWGKVLTLSSMTKIGLNLIVKIISCIKTPNCTVGRKLKLSRTISYLNHQKLGNPENLKIPFHLCVKEWERTERGSLPSYVETIIILWQVCLLWRDIKVVYKQVIF